MNLKKGGEGVQVVLIVQVVRAAMIVWKIQGFKIQRFRDYT
ncbi:MAG: hypothetical protein FD155_3240 [Bacteroidetes bacterium]|nr:MAG: hypothetical protein FD155_3240 [Bacteroidota bacterium]